MAKEIKGKWYVSAGELADYIFCPEHWRLKRIEKVKTKNLESIKFSKTEHKEWGIETQKLLLINKILRTGIIILSVAIAIAYFFGKFTK